MCYTVMTANWPKSRKIAGLSVDVGRLTGSREDKFSVPHGSATTTGKRNLFGFDTMETPRISERPDSED